MVFFNDPVPWDDPALRAVSMAVAMRERVGELASEWHGSATTSTSGSGSRRASRRSADRLRGARRLRRDRHGHEPRGAPLRRRSAGQVLVSQRVLGGDRGRGAGRPVDDLPLKGSRSRFGCSTSSASKGHMGAVISAPANRRSDAGELTEEQRARASPSSSSAGRRSGVRLRTGREGESIVVVPRGCRQADEPAAESQAYEERLLFLLLLLRQPRLRVIYVTSLPIDPDIVDYYLGLLAGVIPAHARARLMVVGATTARRAR